MGGQTGSCGTVIEDVFQMVSEVLAVSLNGKFVVVAPMHCHFSDAGEHLARAAFYGAFSLNLAMVEIHDLLGIAMLDHRTTDGTFVALQADTCQREAWKAKSDHIPRSGHENPGAQ